jgi:high-affinity iron transporter
MFTTFVIGLREGLEAALIVGIVAAFLIQQGRRDALKAMWVGVGLAVLVCLAAAGALSFANQRLPLVAREGLEGALTLLAVAGVTYMLVWMKRHSVDFRGDLEDQTAHALRRNSLMALVALAFVAVIREGLETSIFLFALLEGSSQLALGLTGALLGIVAASGLGYAIYRGGAHVNLQRFFMVTGVVLVVVAAGLVASSIHAFSEAGLVSSWQSPAVDLSGLVAPGTIRAGLLTAFLGLRAVPTYAEVFGWALFLIPALVYVLYPRRLLGASLAK